jgi:hypothetical protein
MNQQPDEMCKLLLRRPQRGGARYLNALRATADFYGWTKVFDVWTPPVVSSEGGKNFFYRPQRAGRGHERGGKNIRICRSPSRQGNPKGFTNRFTVSKSCTMFELSEIAHFTSVDWYWMETITGERLSRDHWEKIYAAGTRG